jgi:hypothetical protein
LIPIKEEIMSKRILTVALVLGILATSNAFASRSRTSVLGSGDAGLFLNAGSFFYDDARNIFYNPSYVNDFKNWGIIEKSNFPGSTAEGGFVTSLSSFNLGVYVNRESSVMNSVANMATVTSGAQRPIELFFGGDASNIKWGVGLDYSMANAPNQSDTNLIFHAGAQVADFEPFGWVSAVGNENIATAGNTTKYKQYGLGLRYKMGEWLPYAGWREDKVVETKADVWLVGLGRTTKIGEGARMNYAVSFVRRTATGAGRSVIPLDVSVEADANSWLTARAGLSHSLYDRTESTTTPANTTGRLGFGMHIGKADMDFSVGKGAALPATAETGGILDSQVFDISNGFFSQASVAYHW